MLKILLRNFLSIFKPGIAKTFVYMLQSTEYDGPAYLKWLWRVGDFGTVMNRRQLLVTRPARFLLAYIRTGMLVQILLGIFLAYQVIHQDKPRLYLALIVLFVLSAPILWANLVVIPLILGRWFIIKPLYSVRVKQSKQVFAANPAIKIAVAGSYGKTTMKEILLTVLGEGKKVAATPANKNVAISHANFAKKLEGDEDILIIEYGEGAPGDVKRFTSTTKPDYGVITGLAPAHLDKYKTLERAGQDIFSLADYLPKEKIYVNSESQSTKPFIKPGYLTYDFRQAAGWKISDVKISISGVSFTMKKSSIILKLKSDLIGQHQVGPLAAAAALAHELGLNKSQIEAGIGKITPFEHRMQARQLSGAWLIDDTYNGNIDGMRAGLQLLKELPAKRKVYITPGLVDQGKESPQIHEQLGKYIASAKPDMVVLMKHSVTDDIVRGLMSAKFSGQLVLEEDPLNFYTNLDKFIAAGDLVVMQNDWPDNYN